MKEQAAAASKVEGQGRRNEGGRRSKGKRPCHRMGGQIQRLDGDPESSPGKKRMKRREDTFCWRGRNCEASLRGGGHRVRRGTSRMERTGDGSEGWRGVHPSLRGGVLLCRERKNRDLKGTVRPGQAHPRVWSLW